MSVVIKKVTDAEGNQFDVGFNLEDSIHYPMASQLNSGAVGQIFMRFADLNGDGTGTYNLIQDYSTVQDIASVAPGSGEVLRIERMIAFIRDGGQFLASGYGALGQLTNGIQVRVQDDGGTIVDLTAQETIVTNAGWGSYCGVDVDLKTWGSGDAFIIARWTFGKSGVPLRLDGDASNQRLEIVLNDDFTGLVNHAFNIQGYYE